MAKRRPSGDGMVRKREDGRWEGRIVVGHKDNGDSIFRYVYADTQKELTARLRKCITAYQGVDLTEQSRLTLSEWLDQWLVGKEGMVRPGTLNGYRGYIENHIRPHLGEKRISQIKAADIQRFYDMLSRKLASGTVRRIHTTLHGILKAAAQARLIPRNPVEEVTPPKFSYQEKKVLTAEQVDRLLEVIQKDTLWHDLFYTELTTGLRRGELCGLRWEDFDAASGRLKVCRTVRRKKGKGLTTGDTKTYAGTRTITLPPSLAVLLKERKRAAKTAWIFPDLLRPERPTAPDAAYRHMKLLTEHGILTVVGENRIRGTVESIYSLNKSALEIDDDGTAVQTALLGLGASFARYFSGGGADPRRDMLLMTTCTLTLTDEEFTGFLTEINQTALKYMDIGVKEGSRQRQITLISSPTDGSGSR